MSQPTERRKIREWAERNERILRIAGEQLVRDGYHGLNMDRIATELEYSKGTIYNHFSCKEEIVIALAVETMERRVALFQRAAAFQGCARHRLCAIGVAVELFFALYPTHFKFEQVLRLDSIWEKTSEKRRTHLRTCEGRCIEIVAGIIRDGLSRRELVLPADTSPEDLVFGLWAMTLGSFSLIAANESLADLGIGSPQSIMNRHIAIILDSYGWKPLSTEVDEDAVRDSVRLGLFAEEYRSLGWLPGNSS